MKGVAETVASIAQDLRASGVGRYGSPLPSGEVEKCRRHAKSRRDVQSGCEKRRPLPSKRKEPPHGPAFCARRGGDDPPMPCARAGRKKRRRTGLSQRSAARASSTPSARRLGYGRWPRPKKNESSASTRAVSSSDDDGVGNRRLHVLRRPVLASDLSTERDRPLIS